MSSNSCFNSYCNVSTSETWKKGWRLRCLNFADLCNSCGCIYDEERFCETFHKYETGWRCCENCGKQVHCGCIVSIHTFNLLDAGGIECMVCARNNAALGPKQMCPPHPLSDYVNMGSNTSFEVDMAFEFERPFLSEHGAAFSSERNQIQNCSSIDGSLKHNLTENPGNVRAGEHFCANSHILDSFHESQQYNVKPAEMRVQKDLLVQYTPKISDEESQLISERTQSVTTQLFEKRLSASDVSKIGRLVIPKKCAEMHFPQISQSEGLPLKIQDVKGKEWIFLFRFWRNNYSRMYVLEGINACIQSLQLQAGDTVSFGHREPEGKLILGFKKAATRPQSDQGTLAVKNVCRMDTTNDVAGRSPEIKQELITSHSKVNKATGRSSSIPVKRKCSTVRFKRKHSRVDSMDFVGLKVTLEEAQWLFRSPLNHAPRVEIIEDFEFEEYEDAPVIGRPTIIDRDSMGNNIQWTQCDSCLKWRKLPFDSLLPARFTCSDNVGNNERLSCEIAQELSLEQLKDLFSIKNTGVAGSNKLQDVELGVHASEELKALGKSNTAVRLASSQLTTKHPRHKNGCSCVVCCQPPGGGPKHQSNCNCNICMMRKRRLQTTMIRRKRIQSKKVVIQEGKSQAMTHSSEKSNLAIELLKSSSKGCADPSSMKSQVDLNSQPERQPGASTRYNSMSLTKMKQDALQRNVPRLGDNVNSKDSPVLVS